MKPSSSLLFLLLPIISILLPSLQAQLPTPEFRTYIVHVHHPPPEHEGTHRDWHESFLPHPSRLLYSYSHILNAFAARLTEAELGAIRDLDGFLHAEPSTLLSLHTTHSPAFLGLYPGPAGFWNAAGYGRGVIIGILDTGISPSHPSFADDGMPPPPSRWKGTCQFPAPFRCNNKLIGAMAFNHTNSSTLPFDEHGHGTHTAGTAAGRFVANASLLGSAAGTAAGMAPDAYVAMYKVCGADGECEDADILAGMEQAVKDGVDVISVSIGGAPVRFYRSTIAIAAFGAASKGVLVSASAGNEGPSPGSVANAAPWILTVGAGTMDRKIRAVVKLGDGQEFEGESAYQPGNFTPTQLPLVFPKIDDDDNATYCTNKTTLQRIGVEGKIVLCWQGLLTADEKGEIVKEAGGAAAILVSSFSSGIQVDALPHVLPASQVTYSDGYNIYLYWESADNPTATIIFKGTAISDPSAPAVTPFSSRGPGKASPGILKPDVFGPGANVLAAWPRTVGPFPIEPSFNILSGTSMSCPHLGGVAALLRGLHPNWSPSMIKSAIMTTADAWNLNGEPIVDLWRKERASFNAMGAGHVNPARAANPGLVYDIQSRDYVAYLCGLGYSEIHVRLITNDTSNCTRQMTEVDLNYPSFSVRLESSVNSSLVVQRTVTNVGGPAANYAVRVVRPNGITVRVAPERLVFAGAGEMLTYTVAFGINATEGARLYPPWTSEGSLVWESLNENVQVKSPMVVVVGSLAPFSVGQLYNVTLH